MLAYEELKHEYIMCEDLHNEEQPICHTMRRSGMEQCRMSILIIKNMEISYKFEVSNSIVCTK